MRTKYRIGDLVKTTGDEKQPSMLGTVHGYVVRRDQEVTYLLDDRETEVVESDISASFTERKSRAKKESAPRASKKKSKSKATAYSDANAA